MLCILFIFDLFCLFVYIRVLKTRSSVLQHKYWHLQVLLLSESSAPATRSIRLMTSWSDSSESWNALPRYSDFAARKVAFRHWLTDERIESFHTGLQRLCREDGNILNKVSKSSVKSSSVVLISSIGGPYWLCMTTHIVTQSIYVSKSIVARNTLPNLCIIIYSQQVREKKVTWTACNPESWIHHQTSSRMP